MKKKMAYCGILCDDCPAYQATQNNDNAGRERITREWATGEYP